MIFEQQNKMYFLISTAQLLSQKSIVSLQKKLMFSKRFILKLRQTAAQCHLATRLRAHRW